MRAPGLVRGLGRSAARRLGALPPRAVLCLGWAVLLLYAYPGLMTFDSYDHLMEARLGWYTDSHPPSISLIWKLSDTIIAGPFGMLVLQSWALLAGLYYLLRRTFAPRRAAWIAVAVFLFPPIMLPMAVIWKDALLAGLLVLGTAGLLSERRGPRLWGLAAMFGAAAVRYNAFAATLPLVVLLFQWRPGMHRLRRYTLAAAAWLATTFAAFGVNAALTDQEMHYWHSSLAVYDIVGTLAHLDHDLPDEELRERLAGTDLLIQRDIHATARAVYSYHFYPIINHEKLMMWRLPIDGYVPAPAAQRDAIARAWWDTITSFPGAYARHRLAITSEVLGFGVKTTAVTARNTPYAHRGQQMQLSTGWSKLQKQMSRWLRALGRWTPIYVPYVYAIVALLLAPLAVRRRDTLAILLSGLAMEGSLVFLAHGPDNRYSHWLVICTTLTALLVAVRRYRGAAPPEPPPPAEGERITHLRS
jgi:hypothetical protein